MPAHERGGASSCLHAPARGPIGAGDGQAGVDAIAVTSPDGARGDQALAGADGAAGAQIALGTYAPAGFQMAGAAHVAVAQQAMGAAQWATDLGGAAHLQRLADRRLGACQ